jgi:hypothetical protein
MKKNKNSNKILSFKNFLILCFFVFSVASAEVYSNIAFYDFITTLSIEIIECIVLITLIFLIWFDDEKFKIGKILFLFVSLICSAFQISECILELKMMNDYFFIVSEICCFIKIAISLAFFSFFILVLSKNIFDNKKNYNYKPIDFINIILIFLMIVLSVIMVLPKFSYLPTIE